MFTTLKAIFRGLYILKLYKLVIFGIVWVIFKRKIKIQKFEAFCDIYTHKEGLQKIIFIFVYPTISIILSIFTRNTNSHYSFSALNNIRSFRLVTAETGDVSIQSSVKWFPSISRINQCIVLSTNCRMIWTVKSMNLPGH